MARPSKTLFLFNPITGETQPTTYEEASKIIGISESALRSFKRRNMFIQEINCFIIEDLKLKCDLMKKVVLEDEIWIDVPEYDGVFQISNYSRIKRLLKNDFKMLIPGLGKSRQTRVYLSLGKKRKCYTVNSLMRKCFFPKLSPDFILMHKDRDVWNCRYTNLKPIKRTDFMKSIQGTGTSKPVLKIDLETDKVLGEYKSVADAARRNYIDEGFLRACVRGEYKTACGFKWREDDGNMEYYDDEEVI